MKDLIMVTSYCETDEKKQVLRNLISQIKKHGDFFDVMIVSHTVVPSDICGMCDLVLYDKKNELLYDWDLRSKPWFNPGDKRQIMSIFTGFYNTHLAIWRMFILGNSVAKNIGYKKVHQIEYDASIEDFRELYDNSKILDEFDCVTYTKTQDTVDNILFGSYQAYRLDTLSEDLLKLDEEKIKMEIKNSPSKSPEGMLYSVLHTGKKGFNKLKKDLDNGGNYFGMSHGGLKSFHTAWCLPYYDQLTENLCFIIWNMEEENENISVQVIYNDEKVFNFEEIKKGCWYDQIIDDYNNAKKLVVILNGKIRNIFDFNEMGEYFKLASFKEGKNR